MTWTKGTLAAAGLFLSISLTGCYTVLMKPQAEESQPRKERAASEPLLEPVGEESGTYADSELDTWDREEESERDVTVNRFYIYDSWPGHWYYDPFWDSPFAWSYSTWWWGSMYNPWYTPWPYYAGWGWRNTYYPFYHGYSPWHYPGYYDPYWVYADHDWNHHGGDPNQRRPFNRRELVHTRDAGLVGGSAVPASARSSVTGVGKAESPAMVSGTRRVQRTGDMGVSKSSAGSAPASTSRRVRRQESGSSGGSGSIQRTGRSAPAGKAKSGGGSSGSGRRERRESSGSGNSSPSYHPPSSSGSSGSSGSGGSGSSGGSSRSGGSSSSGSSGSGGGRPSRR
ncbi:MAG: hypothetical protein QUS35_02040 [bacterium]|nr:hypothetical protein [bacterium]